jgi:hypothetical protein
MESIDCRRTTHSRTPARWSRLSTASLALGAVLAPIASGQTPSQFAGWDALMLSPIGAFTPAISIGSPASPGNTVALRFGRWRYNTDDAAHETYGVSWFRALGSRARASITGGYAYLSCVDCGGWEVVGLDLETSLWQRVVRADAIHPVRTSLSGRFSAGGGFLRGAPGSVARSVAVEAPIDFHVRYRTGHELRASLTPGLGYGSMWAPGGSDGGLLRMLGLTVASDLTSSLGIELGTHRVFIDRGPVELGVSLVWGFR